MGSSVVRWSFRVTADLLWSIHGDGKCHLLPKTSRWSYKSYIKSPTERLSTPLALADLGGLACIVSAPQLGGHQGSLSLWLKNQLQMSSEKPEHGGTPRQRQELGTFNTHSCLVHVPKEYDLRSENESERILCSFHHGVTE